MNHIVLRAYQEKCSVRIVFFVSLNRGGDAGNRGCSGRKMVGQTVGDMNEGACLQSGNPVGRAKGVEQVCR